MIITKTLYPIAVAIIATTLASCVNNGSGKTNEEENDSSNFIYDDMATEHEDRHDIPDFSDTMPVDPFQQQILDAIANGKKELFAELVNYPLHRKYPLHDIENEQQMIRYFDTLFDKSFRERVAKLDHNSWDNVGWRGWMILNGEIWDTGIGIIVNHYSPLEQRYAEYLKKKDMARVHPSLRGKWVPFDCYFLDSSKQPDFEYSYARIDISAEHAPYAENTTYRLSLFKKGSKASDAPALVFFGELELAGSMNIMTYYFKSDKYYIHIDPEDVEDGNSYFKMTIRGNTEKGYRIPCRSQMQPF